MVSGIVSVSTKDQIVESMKYMKSRIILLVLAALALVAGSVPAAESHTGWWHGRRIVYQAVNGRATWQGDIVLRLGDISSIPPVTATPRTGAQRHATFIGDP